MRAQFPGKERQSLKTLLGKQINVMIPNYVLLQQNTVGGVVYMYICNSIYEHCIFIGNNLFLRVLEI